MRKFRWMVFALALGASGGASAVGGDEGMTPINVINETGKDVGACLDGGALAYAPKAYKGIAYFVPKADAAFAAAHAALAKNEEKWVKDMSGPSAQNRLYVDKAGNQVLVLWFCKQGNCGTYNAYATFNLATQEYGIELSEVAKHRSIGAISSPSRAAIACAGMIDQRLRAETEAKMFGRGKGAKP